MAKMKAARWHDRKDVRVEELEILPDDQRNSQQPELEYLFEPHVNGQPALPTPWFGVHGQRYGHPAMERMEP